jgi:hypothetical protein
LWLTLLGINANRRFAPDKENHMKNLKMLGLAAIAALGLMAFVGAGTASATTLSTDAAGTVKYGVGTEISSSLKAETSALLETTAGEKIATCTTSSVGGKITTATGTWVTGTLESLTWGDPEGKNCSQPTKSLVTEEVEGKKYYGKLEIMKTGADEGEVVGKNSSVTLSVFGVSCVYGTSAEGNKLGTVKGGEAPELVINAVLPKKEGGFLCPSSGRWTATYIVTTPHALHVVE